MAAAERVEPGGATAMSSSKHVAATPVMPTRTMWASQMIGAPARMASMPACTAASVVRVEVA